ncbi:Metacaspase-6 (AtMC6) (Metacaspase 2c) (AtMCP2c) (Metacaspase-5) [Durusdinium trenchii]|uniref:Metacaspase-6 (AtMC6) (Metacaspase 2c) (AtMCP2c) (Metacaspase-5) n=1 Tax=Durusdinium trenchii TaxID=1381693 RepID=A0ABP0PRW4_9DINO
MRITCLHGVGGQSSNRAWQHQWKESVRRSLRRAGREADVEFEFLAYDHIFDDYQIRFQDTLVAVQRLLSSGATQLWRRVSGQEGIFDGINQTALKADPPDVILAHSLGSLVGYDLLTHPDGEGLFDGVFVSLGAQIGNPFVVGNFLAGRIEPIPGVIWYHLFNRWDDVFTSEIHLSSPAFTQIETPFGEWGSLDHDATKYLDHDNTVSRMWAVLPDVVREPVEELLTLAERPVRPPIKRALLVGIDDYAEPRYQLQGAVNDVFLMSSVLQEKGYAPDDIRLLVNHRATAAAIRERLEWLFHDAQNGDEIVFHFSGHGVALPGYNAQTVVDRIYECLVPYDFDGSLESAVTDEDIHSMYVHLPYETNVTLILDCCHAGGQARAGMAVRGIEPPEDVRHRSMRWDADRGLWVARSLLPLTPNVMADDAKRERFAGEQGATIRIGRGMAVRRLSEAEFHRSRSDRNHRGPFMPVIFEACGAEEHAFEYHHGAAVYGAFSFAIAHCLRRLVNGHGRDHRAPITYRALMDEVTTVLRDSLRLTQTPSVVGPTDVVARPVSFSVPAAD